MDESTAVQFRRGGHPLQEPLKKELLSKPQYNSADVREQLVSAAKIIKNFENKKSSDEIIREQRKILSFIIAVSESFRIFATSKDWITVLVFATSGTSVPLSTSTG